MFMCVSAVRLERLETFYIASIKLLNYGVESFQTDQQIHVLKGLYTPDYTLQLIHFSFLVIEAPALETLPDLVWCVSPSDC